MNSNNTKTNKTKEKLALLSVEIKTHRKAYGMLAPFLIFFILFVIVALIASVVLSFFNLEMPHSAEFTGIDNYKFLFNENDMFKNALINTLWSLLITGVGGFVLIVVTAFALSNINAKLSRIFAIILVIPSFVYGAYAITGIFASEQVSGMLNGILLSAGWSTSAENWLSKPVFSILLPQLTRLWGTFGIGFLAVLHAFSKRDNDLYAVAKIDGVNNRFHEFFLITFPHSIPELTLAGVLQIVAAFGAGNEFITTAQNMTLTDYMLFYGASEFNIGISSALVTLIAVACGIIWLVIRTVAKHFDVSEKQGGVNL